MLGTKLKSSHSKSRFYNNADWCCFHCPTGHELACYVTMVAQRYSFDPLKLGIKHATFWEDKNSNQ